MIILCIYFGLIHILVVVFISYHRCKLFTFAHIGGWVNSGLGEENWVSGCFFAFLEGFWTVFGSILAVKAADGYV